jgi:hypothetical protein
MMWIDYTVESFADGSFHVKGEWPGEVMGYDKHGIPGAKERPLYSPGDVFIVQENGVLKKSDPLTELLIKYEAKKDER